MEVLSNIGFDWQVALANFVSFLIIFFILKKWVFGPVGTLLDERKSKIETGIARAQEGEERSKLAEQEAHDMVMEARSKANQVVAQAQEKADAISAQTSERVSQESEAILDQARQRIEHEEQIALRELSKKASSLVVLGVEKVLGKKVDQDIDRELAEQTLAELEDKLNTNK